MQNPPSHPLSHTGEAGAKVRDVFARVAPYYDQMNDVASLGLHRLWKKEVVRRLGIGAQPRYLVDMASGSGDIAFRAAKQMAQGSRIYCIDNNAEMLALGEARATQTHWMPELQFFCAPAEVVPLSDACADSYVVAFGMRNFQSRETALAEAYRVLQTGGHFLCLEFSPTGTNSFWQSISSFWTNNIVPKLGEALAQDKESYEYLRDSIARFPSAKMFAQQITQAGFRQTRWQFLAGGVVALHEGWK